MILAAISGQRVDHPGRCDYVVKDWQEAGLLMPSVVRAGKPATLQRDLMRRSLGTLPEAEPSAVNDLLREALAV